MYGCGWRIWMWLECMDVVGVYEYGWGVWMWLGFGMIEVWAERGVSVKKEGR